MRAVTLDSFESSPEVRHDLATPTMNAGDVLVRVHASSVNPVDAAIGAGMLRAMAEYEFPVTLGRDFAGLVERVGSDVANYKAGDAVYGFLAHANPTVHEGAWAEYAVVRQGSTLARKPDRVDFATAGAAPLAGFTALGALDALELSEGATVLVVGANGGVGSVFVQLAAEAGAKVIAPALPEDAEYLGGLGVSDVIDRGADASSPFLERYPDGVDAVFDLVSFAPDESVLKPGGRLASTLGAAGAGPGRTNVMGVPTASNLERLGQLLESGSLRIPIKNSYPLEHAGQALADLTGAHMQGKLAIAIP